MVRTFPVSGLVMAVVVAALLPRAAHTAQPAYPVKPIRLLVPFTPGGAVDLVARRIAPKMSAMMTMDTA